MHNHFGDELTGAESIDESRPVVELMDLSCFRGRLEDS